MKKFSRIFLITAGILLVAGLGFTVAGAALGGIPGDQILFGDGWSSAVRSVGTIHLFGMDFDHNVDWDEDLDDEAGYTSQGDSRVYETDLKKQINVQLKYASLIFEKYDGEKLRVEVRNDPKETIHVGDSGNTLKIVGKKNKKNQTVTVFYPDQAEFDEVTLNMGAGEIAVNSDFSADELEMEVGAGDFYNKGNITVRECSLEVGAGYINMSGLKVEELEGECGAGSMVLNLQGKQTDYNYSLEMGIGEIQLGSDIYEGLGKEKIIDNAGAVGNIELECGVGEITVRFQES